MSLTKPSLSGTTKLLHIVVALFMITLLTVGIYMSNTETYSLYPIHKSFGAIVLLLALARIFWRVKKGWPTPLGKASKLQLAVAKLVHWLLITATVLYPISGLMMSIAGGHGLSVFGLELVAMNFDAAGEVIAINGTIAGIGHEIHGLLVPVVITAIVLHVAGALKHHVIDKDDTITRMFSFK